MTIDLLKNNQNRNALIDNIKRKYKQLEDDKWTIYIQWVKAHIGNHGNEMADKLAKEAAKQDDLPLIYQKTPKTEVVHHIKLQSTEKWQLQWNQTTKGAETKQFFPNIKERLKNNIRLTPNFTAIVTGHGKTRSYLHRFKVIDSPLWWITSSMSTRVLKVKDTN